MRIQSILGLSTLVFALGITPVYASSQGALNEATKNTAAPATHHPIKILGQTQLSDVSKLRFEQPTDIVMGNPKAPVTLIEYSSLTCPHCAHFSNDIFPTIKKDYIDTGKVKYISRDFPLDGAALKAAKLPHCAGKDRYFDFLKVLFKTQDNWAHKDDYQEILGNIARLGGMSGADFDKCMNDKELELSIADTRLHATQELNITSTPTFFINGEKLPGVGNIQAFVDVLEKALKKAPSAAAQPAKAPAKETIKKAPVATNTKSPK